MSNSSGSKDLVAQEYATPIAEIISFNNEQSILTFSNEHTGEEELF